MSYSVVIVGVVGAGRGLGKTGTRRDFGMSRVVCLLSLCVSCLLACAPHMSQNVRDPVRDEELVHRELSLFYCEQKRWPRTWEEFTTWAALSTSPVVAQGTASPRNSFIDAKVSSPRAILLTVTYFDRANAERLVSYIAPPTCQPDSDPQVVAMAGERVTFELPSGFDLLSAAAIQERWKNGAYPDVAWENATQNVILAVRFGETPVALQELAKMARLLEQAFNKSVPTIEWIAKRVKSGGEQPRIIHEFESDSSRGRLVTVGMSFSFDQKLLSLNLVGPAEKRKEVEAAAEAVRASLRLSE